MEHDNIVNEIVLLSTSLSHIWVFLKLCCKRWIILCKPLNVKSSRQRSSWWAICLENLWIVVHGYACKKLYNQRISQDVDCLYRDVSAQNTLCFLVIFHQKQFIGFVGSQEEEETEEIQDWHTWREHKDYEGCGHHSRNCFFTMKVVSFIHLFEIILGHFFGVWLIVIFVLRKSFQI